MLDLRFSWTDVPAHKVVPGLKIGEGWTRFAHAEDSRKIVAMQSSNQLMPNLKHAALNAQSSILSEFLTL
tara:strand:- start:124 stop:333 length:210 start_codon:yes stop_codon:yes gene_type:complete